MTEATSGSANRNAADSSGPSPRQEANKTPNYYERLGLRPGASVQEIRRAYRDLSKLYHPDTTELESALAIPKFQALNEAYATLTSPEKRLSYDYKIGYSRISVIQPPRELSDMSSGIRSKFSSSAYLDPSDRPLSAGELFALFILGITFVGCLLLVVTISLTKGDVAVTQISPPAPLNAPPISPPAPDFIQPPALPSNLPELPQQPWLVPKAPSQIYPVYPPASPVVPNFLTPHAAR